MFRTYVEAGRVAYINFGADYGKLCVVVDLLNDKKVLVDGPSFPRVIYPLRRLTLTKFKLPVQRGARTGSVLKAWKAADMQKKWDESSVAQKMARFAKRASLSDYERFAVMVHRRKRAAQAKDMMKPKGKAAAPVKGGKAAAAKGGKAAKKWASFIDLQ